MRNVAVILGVFAAGVGLWVGLVRGPSAAPVARGQFGAGRPPFLATQPGGTAVLAAEGYEFGGAPALPESDPGAAGSRVEEAQPAPAAQPPTDDKPPTELVADIDGDGTPDRVWVTKEVGERDAYRRAYIEADVGGAHVIAGPYVALGLASPSQVRRLPHELDDLQILPPTSLDLADVNLDGTPELVARFGVPRSGGSILCIVLAWDAEHKTFRQILESDEHALLCADATGAGQSAMFSFEIVAGRIPVVRNIWAWDGERYVHAQPALSARVAKALLPLYPESTSTFGPYYGPSVLEGYASAAVGVGRPLDAVRRTRQALAELDELERAAASARWQMLRTLAGAQIAAGDEQGGIESFRAAGDLDNDPKYPPEVKLAFTVAGAYAAAGARDKALAWIDRAEEVVGTPGAYADIRERYAKAPNLLAMEAAKGPGAR